MSVCRSSRCWFSWASDREAWRLDSRRFRKGPQQLLTCTDDVTLIGDERFPA